VIVMMMRVAMSLSAQLVAEIRHLLEQHHDVRFLVFAGEFLE
jgi:hypothetical protein